MARPVPTDTQNLDRRQFINGRWTSVTGAAADPAFEVASILVQTRPERLDAAAAAVAALPGTEIHGRDPKGKLVVVVEADGVGRIGATLATISSMPDVLTAALVFHGTAD
jgi:nitrate reductase NapD